MNRWDEQMARLDRHDGTKPFVLEVGANDGFFQAAFWHAIVNWGWHGLLIEPVECLYQKLVARYTGCPNVACCQVAISDEPGVLRLRVPDHDAPPDVLGSSSACITSAMGGAETKWHTEEVPAERLQTVLDRYGVTRLDAVNIDVEGMDACVLGQLDLERYRPRLLKLEILFLEEYVRREVRRYLTANGYSHEPLGDQDLVAWLP